MFLNHQQETVKWKSNSTNPLLFPAITNFQKIQVYTVAPGFVFLHEKLAIQGGFWQYSFQISALVDKRLL